MLSFVIGLCEKLWDDFIHEAGRLFEEHKSVRKPVIENGNASEKNKSHVTVVPLQIDR